jgi:protein transport protein SEC24
VYLYGPSVADDDFAVANFGNVGIIRCSSCRAYINPFSKFLRAGAIIQCNICDNIDSVVEGYKSALNSETGRRVDYLERVELNQASYDIRAG